MSKQVLKDLMQIFKSSVSAVLPENLIRRTLNYNPLNQELIISGEKYSLLDKNVYLVGTGKAVQSMAKEVQNMMGPKVINGIVSIPEGSLLTNETHYQNVSFYEGARNNLPDECSLNTSRKILDLVANLGVKDLLIVLISGGGSALLSLPKPPISLYEKAELIKRLASAGADIKELNIVRKRLSTVKGGQLAIKAQPASVISLVLSDIVGDPLDLIASGPTVENTDSPNMANDIIYKYHLYDDLPKAIKSVLEQTDLEKGFPKDNVKDFIIGSNLVSINAAIEEAKSLNYLPIKLSHTITGNVLKIAEDYVKMVLIFTQFLVGNMDEQEIKEKLKHLNLPGLHLDIVGIDAQRNEDICLILGGETTVEVKGNGKGGRNQHLALEFSKQIHPFEQELSKFNIYLLSAGTDGIDGPTNAAGAIGYTTLVSNAKDENLNVNKYLDKNDSYNFYKEFKNGDLHVITGHTNTNVMDIHLILIKWKNV